MNDVSTTRRARMTPRQRLSFEEASELVDYDARSGQLVWRVSKRGRIKQGREIGRTDSHGHRQVTINGKTLMAHQLAWLLFYGEYPSRGIDHINGDRSDNRILNLRLASATENNRNAKLKRTNSSGLKGVSAHGGRWKAQICAEYRKIHLGVFGTKEEAHAAYSAAAKILHGQFARLK